MLRKVGSEANPSTPLVVMGNISTTVFSVDVLNKT
jgi:hypothetical protein